jgi:hypothetical protein
LKNGISFKDIDEMDSESFFDYLERQVDNQQPAANELSGADFFNKF